jgi:hypothetical protein
MIKNDDEIKEDNRSTLNLNNKPNSVNANSLNQTLIARKMLIK